MKQLATGLALSFGLIGASGQLTQAGNDPTSPTQQTVQQIPQNVEIQARLLKTLHANYTKELRINLAILERAQSVQQVNLALMLITDHLQAERMVQSLAQQSGIDLSPAIIDAEIESINALGQSRVETLKTAEREVFGQTATQIVSQSHDDLLQQLNDFKLILDSPDYIELIDFLILTEEKHQTMISNLAAQQN
jgi:hypothetical protein